MLQKCCSYSFDQCPSYIYSFNTEAEYESTPLLKRSNLNLINITIDDLFGSKQLFFYRVSFTNVVTL